MSSSSSCSSSSFSSFSSCSSSSSYTGFSAPSLSVTDGNFEVLAHDTSNNVIVNSGVGYDGYGNRLSLDVRRKIQLDFSDILGSFAYLCIRRRTAPILIDYQDHPYYCLPKATKRAVDVEFYLTEDIVGISIDNGYGYYPALDDNNIINGLVLAKVYKNASDKPDITWRSPMLAVKDGTFFNLDGFNVG